jgi:hypothetical protein
MASDAHRPPTRPRYLWSKADWVAVKSAMKAYAWKEKFANSTSVDECYNDFVAFYTAACDTHIPKTTAPVKPLTAPWMTSELRATVEQKRVLFGRLRAAGAKHK